jgi:hypothetical protein
MTANEITLVALARHQADRMESVGCGRTGELYRELADAVQRLARERDRLIEMWPEGDLDNPQGESKGAVGLNDRGRWAIIHEDADRVVPIGRTFGTKEGVVRTLAGLGYPS